MTPSKALLTGALLLLTSGTAALATPASAGSTAVPEKLNVVFVLTDDQTLDAVDKMPYVSGQRWVRFSNAQVENGLCCPSRATILQGRYDVNTQVTNNSQGSLFDPRETLPVWLQRAGYRTGLFGKYLNSYKGRGVPTGWNDWQGVSGLLQYTQYNYIINNNGVRETYGSTPDDYQLDVITDKAVTFIEDSAAAEKPFFMYFTPTATHAPWRASPARTDYYKDALVTHDASFNEADVSDKPAHIRALPLLNPTFEDKSRRRMWDASLSVDDAIARMDQTLKATGQYDKTVLVVTSDNGYSFGDHRWQRKRCEYNECLRVPLLVRYPGQGPRTDRHLISNIDFASTISEIAGATPTLPQDGRSFLHFVQPAAPVQPTWRRFLLQHWSGGDAEGVADQPDSFPQFWSVVSSGGWKYVELDTGEKELYDGNADPYELVNRAGHPDYASQQALLQRELARLKQKAGADRLPLNTSMPGPGLLGPDMD